MDRWKNCGKQQTDTILKSRLFHWVFLGFLLGLLATHDDYSLTEQIKKVMAVPGTNSGTPEMIRQSCIVFGFYTDGM